MHTIKWGAIPLLVVFLSILGGCSDEFAPERCLPDNSPWCNGSNGNDAGTVTWTCAGDSLYLQPCGDGGQYVCNTAGDLVCSATPWDCETDSHVGQSCGNGGQYVCDANGGLICQQPATQHDGGTNNDSSPGHDSAGGYSCANDQLLGTSCLNGQGTFVCNSTGTGLTCLLNGDGGSSGGQDSGSGGYADGGVPGGATCTPAGNIAVTLSSSTLLHSVMSDGSGYDTALSQLRVLTPGQRLVVAVEGNLTASANVGAVNAYKAYPSELYDVMVCKLLGVTDPSQCNSTVIGDRTGSAYLVATGQVENCWAHNTCAAQLGGLVPATAFSLFGTLRAGVGLPTISAGTVHLVLDVPPLCP